MARKTTPEDRIARIQRRIDYLDRAADNHFALAELSALEWIVEEYRRLKKLEEEWKTCTTGSPACSDHALGMIHDEPLPRKPPCSEDR